MEQWLKVGLLLTAFGIVVMLQILACRLRSRMVGLLLPLLFLSVTTLVMGIQLISQYYQCVSRLEIMTHYALYNVPTIIFLCIFNYYQRGKRVK